MSAILGFIGVLTLIVGWWLSRQGLGVKPWLQVDQASGVTQSGASPHAPAQVGLGVFLAVVGSLFSLLRLRSRPSVMLTGSADRKKKSGDTWMPHFRSSTAEIDPEWRASVRLAGPFTRGSS